MHVNLCIYRYIIQPAHGLCVQRGTETYIKVVYIDVLYVVHYLMYDGRISKEVIQGRHASSPFRPLACAPFVCWHLPKIKM